MFEGADALETLEAAELQDSPAGLRPRVILDVRRTAENEMRRLIAFYEELALKLSSHRRRVLAAAAIGLAICAGSVLLPFNRVLPWSIFSPTFALGFAVTIFAWGCDLLVYWYSPEQVDSRGRPVLLLVPRELGRVGAAPFLLLWFVVPVVTLIFTTIALILKALR